MRRTLDAASQGTADVLTQLGEEPSEMRDHYADMPDHVAGWLADPGGQS